MIRLDDRRVKSFIRENELVQLQSQVNLSHQQLIEGTGAGSDYVGWVDLPVQYDRDEFARIKTAAAWIREHSDVLVVIGIGGSYLGARAVIDALSHNFNAALTPAQRRTPLVLFAGNNISANYLADLFDVLEGRRVSLNVISKSGTTTEPAIAFRILKQYMDTRYPAAEVKQRIFVTTDRARGALKELADEVGYETFVVPDDIGGRYSVLTAVGLLPIAVAGIDIEALMQGAAAAREQFVTNPDLTVNDACRYAAIRNLLLRRGYKVELMVNYEPALHYLTEWWKQLYGESEGKDGKGIFPAGVDFSTDLHSMGQYIQDGQRFLFETVLSVANARSPQLIPEDAEDLDGLNFLSGKDMNEVNRTAALGTALAHVDGGVPNLGVELPELSATTLGELIYFFEFACGISGYLNAVNPFDQEGVEDYKRNMFALLGKPGFEARRQELEARL